MRPGPEEGIEIEKSLWEIFMNCLYIFHVLSPSCFVIIQFHVELLLHVGGIGGKKGD